MRSKKAILEEEEYLKYSSGGYAKEAVGQNNLVLEVVLDIREMLKKKGGKK